MLIRTTACCLILVIVAQVCAAADNKTREFELDNGLKVIVQEDHRAPVVVSQIWYKVGSSYESSGQTGISHVLEHMMFKGTRRHGPGEFSRIISINGGRENAFTGRDYTAYFQQLAKDRLRVSFELEADRMRHLTLSKQEFDKEINVVMEERRLRTEDDPQAKLDELFNAGAFISGPYHHPIIGWMDDLQNLRVDDIKKWYQTWYAPNNATLVVVGDINPDRVYKLAEKYFGDLKPSHILMPKPRHEIRQQGQRQLDLKAPAELPYLIMGYKVPVLKTADAAWEPYALEVLAGILDGGNSARLARDIVRGKQIAADAGAGYNMFARLDDVFTLDGTPAPQHDIQGLETAFRQQIDDLRNQLVSEDELKRVKAQVVAADVYQRDSVFYQAMQIGMLETVGLDWHLIDNYVDRIREITAQQVQAVARKYLIDDNLTVAILEPQQIKTDAQQEPEEISHEQ